LAVNREAEHRTEDISPGIPDVRPEMPKTTTESTNSALCLTKETKLQFLTILPLLSPSSLLFNLNHNLSINSYQLNIHKLKDSLYTLLCLLDSKEESQLAIKKARIWNLLHLQKSSHQKEEFWRRREQSFTLFEDA